MDKTLLYYGDVIMLYDERNRGYMYARGFINKTLLFNTSPNTKSESHFIILPKIINVETVDDERFKGNPNPVLFGSEFCLKHVDSGYFVNGSSETVESLNGFRVGMSERFTKDCVFKLLPQRTFQHEGDLIYLNSLCVIKHPKVNSYISVEQQEAPPPTTEVRSASRMNSSQVSVGQFLPQSGSGTLTISNPHIFSETETLRSCKLSHDKNSSWRFCLRPPNQLPTKRYLQPNDYVYFVHSEDNSIVTVDASNSYITFKFRDYNQSEIYRALWEVEYGEDRKTREEEMRLRHLLTGQYFSQTLSKSPVKITLRPIIRTENRLPPFDIYINNDKFTKLSARENDQLHGFQVNMFDKTYIKEILSVKGMHPQVWVPYFINFLKTDTSIKQSMLREFGIIQTVILILQNRSWDRPDLCYNLLYDVCKGNIINKKKVCQSIELILREPNKLYSQELLTELLTENYDQIDDVIEKEIGPVRIANFLSEFTQPHNNYNVQYMRILRAFTGTSRKANFRNQNFIFHQFFHLNDIKSLERDRDRDRDLSASMLAQSIPNFSVPEEMKFRLQLVEGRVEFEHFERHERHVEPLEQLPEQKREFVRQYFYLLGDCMKSRNEHNIQMFQKEFKLNVLCAVLRDDSLRSLYGPVLNLIKCAYVDYAPYYRCEMYFLNRESKLAFEGCLLSILPEGSELFFVLDFLKQEIPRMQQFFDSYNLILLETLKLTIEFGFWRDMNQLLDIRRTLERLIFTPSEGIWQRELRSETRRKSNNLVLSKIMAVEIYRLLLNLQLNLWVSDLIRLPESAVAETIDGWLESPNSQWKLDSRFFALASEKDSELMKNSLKLFYRLFNIKQELYQLLKEAVGDELSDEQPKSPERIQREKQQQKFAEMCTKEPLSTDNCLKVLNHLIEHESRERKFERFEELAFNSQFQSMLSDRHMDKYFQALSIKFGLHIRIIDELAKINPDLTSVRIKPVFMYLYLLLAIIKDNMANKRAVSRHRKDIIKFLSTKQVSGLCIEFIEELYRNNKHLITDYKEVENLSESILRSLKEARFENRLYECCKHLTVLHELITLQNKELQSNQSILIFQIFKKDYSALLEPTTTQSQSEAAALYNIIMYSLMNSLGQETVKKKFLIRYPFDLLSGLLSSCPNNWQLRSRLRLYINESYLKHPDQHPNQKDAVEERPPLSLQSSPSKDFREEEEQPHVDMSMLVLERSESDIEEVLLRSCLSDLDTAIKALEQERTATNRWEMFDFERNLRQIITTFKRILILIQKSSAPEEGRTEEIRRLMLDVSKKLYLIKDYCSTDVMFEIESLKPYFSILEKKNGSEELVLSSSEQLSPDKQPMEFSRKRNIPQAQLNRFLRYASRSSLTVYSHDHISKIDRGVLKNFISNVIDINARDDSVLSDNIKLFIVNFLSESMLNEQSNLRRKRDLDMRFSDINQEKVAVFQKGQELYSQQEYHIPELICSLMEESFHQRYKLFNGVLELGICLVIGGNTHFQNRFIRAFKKDRKNTIFSNLAGVISETLKNIEFFYKSPSKSEDDSRLVYPTLVRYELNMDFTEIEASREERRCSCALVWKVFRFLQLLCENNNKEMKEYIQNQSDEQDRVKYTSINFIEEANKTLWEVMDILKGNLREIRSFALKLKDHDDEQERIFYESFKAEVQENLCVIPLLIVEFLIEVCQIPSEKNQVYLCCTNFFETIRRLEECIAELDDGKLKFGQQRFSDSITTRENGVQVPFFFAIEKKIIVLIRSLLEPNDHSIKGNLKKNFTKQAFRFLLVEAFHYGAIVDIQKLEMVLHRFEVNAQLLNIISLLIIKKSLEMDLSFLKENSSDDNCCITQPMLAMLESRIRSIEVDLYGKTLTVYFPYNPLFAFLSKSTKDEIIYRRFESRNEKLRDLLYSRAIIYKEIEYEYQVHAKLINEKSLEKLFQVSLYASYLIVAMLILFYSVTGLALKLDTIEQSVMLYASSVQFLLSLMYIILWGIHQAPIAMLTYMKKKEKSGKEVEQSQSSTRNFMNKVARLPGQLKAIYFENYKSWTVLVFFTISFMSAFISVRFYAFNFFFLFAQLDVFKNIFKAILTNAKQLAVVCMFGLTFAFVFAFVTLNNYLIPLYENEQVDIDIAKSSKEHCNTVFSCVVSLYTQHIIGEGSPGSQTTDYNRFLYDLLFISFFGIFFNNIVSGIMIDKFAELRDTREKVEHEIRNKCYICSADKATVWMGLSQLEKRLESFQTHIQEVHHVWNYFFYMYTLERIKSSNDFTGIEYWIQDKINKDDIEWFPYERKYKENILEDKIAAVEEKLDRLLRERDESAVKREE